MRRIVAAVLFVLFILMGINTVVLAKDSIDRTITFEDVATLASDGELRYLGIYSTQAASREKCLINIDRSYTHNGSSQSILFYTGSNRNFYYNTDSAVVMKDTSTNAQTVDNCYQFEYKYYFKIMAFEENYADGLVLSDDAYIRYGSSSDYRFFLGLKLQLISDSKGKRIEMTDSESRSVNLWENGENDWIEIKRIFDFDKSTVDTYANGELLLSKIVDGLSHIRYSNILVKGTNPNYGIYFDDISSKSLERPPVIDEIVGKRDSIHLVFSKSLDTATVTKDRFSLTVNGEPVEIAGVEYIAEENKVLVTPSELMYLEEEYTLTVSGDIKGTSGAALGGGEPTEKKFTISAEPFDILKVSLLGGKVVANLKNTTGEEKSAIMAVLFKNAQGSIVACGYSRTETISEDGTQLNVALPGKGEKSCEVFFMDNWTSRLAIKKYIYNMGEEN